MKTALFRKQHEELGRIVDSIAEKLHSAAPNDLVRDLAKLSGVLRVHLRIEDASMYPAMLASGNPAVREMAAEYRTTMGDLVNVFETYYAKWTAIGAIARDRSTFVADTSAVAAALMQRISMENDNLYALIDSEDLVVV